MASNISEMLDNAPPGSSSPSGYKPPPTMGVSTSCVATGEAEPYVPTCEDLFAARACLLTKVPTELANIILDHACYWPKVSARYTTNGRYMTLISNAASAYDAVACVLLSPKLSDWMWSLGDKEAFVQVQRVCFKITSHDQGQSHSPDLPGKYRGSSTWFETAIVRDTVYDKDPSVSANDAHTRIQAALNTRTYEEKPRVTTVRNPRSESDGEADVWHIQTNRRGWRHSMTHEVVWTRSEDDGGDGDEKEKVVFEETGSKLGRGFVRALGREDRIAVIARAMYPGSSNHIGSVDLEIYYTA